jgi:hypothetical protein
MKQRSFVFNIVACIYRKKTDIFKIQSDIFLHEGWADLVMVMRRLAYTDR